MHKADGVVLRVDADASVVDDLTRQLERELDSIEGLVLGSPDSTPPPGSKGDGVSVGVLVVSLVVSSGALPALVDTIRSWLIGSGASIDVEYAGRKLSLTQVTQRERTELIKLFTESAPKVTQPAPPVTQPAPPADDSS